MSPILLYLSLLAIAFGFSIIPKAKTFKYKHLQDYIYLLLAIILGASVAENLRDNYQLSEEEELYTLAIIDGIQQKTKYQRIQARIIGQGEDLGKIKESNANVLIYAEPKELNTIPEIGDSLFFFSAFRQINKPKNPNGFDFKKFMRNKGIFCQTFLKKETYKILPQKNGLSWKKWVAQRQRKLLDVFEKYLIQEDNIAVAKAMILGNKENMSAPLSRRFAVTGSMHILAVSGMHVGIVSMMILGFLSLFRSRTSQLKIMKGIVSIILVWLYAAFTGAGPAVIRASLMFSLFFIAKFILKREVSVYNILCASAFIMLLLDPNQLFQLGFQLSFLAVISIVFFYPHLRKLFLSPYPVLNSLIACLNVSIAAQLLVFPLSIYHFNMFSPAFVLTSFFLTFAATAILGLGIILLIGSSLGLESFCQNLIAPLLEGSLEFLNQSLHSVEDLEFLKVLEYNIDSSQLCLLYIVVMFLMIAIGLKNKLYLYYSLTIIIMFCIYSHHKKLNIYSQPVAYLYSQKEEAYLEFYERDNCYTLGSIKKDNHFFKQEIKKTRLIHHTDHVFILEDNSDFDPVEYADPYLRIGSYLIAFAKAEKIKKNFLKKNLDFLLVNNESDELEKIDPQVLEKTTIILDASLSYFREKELEQWITERGLTGYNIKKEGALKIEL